MKMWQEKNFEYTFRIEEQYFDGKNSKRANEK